MDIEKLKERGIYNAAALARGDGLSVLVSLCESQKTIRTNRVIGHVDLTKSFMADSASTLRDTVNMLDVATKKLEQWDKVAGWIHDRAEQFDGDDSARSSLLSEIGRVLDMAFGHMPSAIERISK